MASKPKRPPSDAELESIRDSVLHVGRLSDGLLTFGPFSIGLDGLLSWLPGAGEAYSAGAAAFILGQGMRAGVPLGVLIAAAGLMAGRTAITAVPLAGPALADLLTTHKWSARMIAAAIDRKRSGVSGQRRAPEGNLRQTTA